jgi:chitinase domain-containing protein 1
VRVLVPVLVFQVVPRVVLEAFPAVVLLEKKQKANAIDLIVSECR